MRKSTITLVILGVLGVLLLAGCSGKASEEDKRAGLKQVLEGVQNAREISTGGTDSGNVLVELTPHAVSDGQLRVDMSVNTHSVGLDQFDLKEIITLEMGGRSYNPTEAPSLSGHHSSGTLVFDIESEENTFTITIVGIPKVERREFVWRGEE